jgi:hypothetical protein
MASLEKNREDCTWWCNPKKTGMEEEKVLFGASLFGKLRKRYDM